MSTFVTSKNTRAQHVSPRQCVPYRPSPARREAIHGRVRPMVDEPGMGGPIGLAVLLIATVFIGFIIAKPHHAASVDLTAPRSAASTSAPSDAGSR